VGLAGLLGAGRTELARLLFGLAAPDRGRLLVDGQAVSFASPGDAIRHGLALCPEERKTDGIVAELSLRENIALALQARLGLARFMPLAEQTALAERYVAALGIRCASVETPIGLLSGGNQQKAVIARWLATAPRLLILDEPTRGIDVAAKQEIMAEITAAGPGWHGGVVHLVRDERGGAGGAPHRGAARPPQGGRAAGRHQRGRRLRGDCRDMNETTSHLASLLRHRLAWPLITLVLLLAINTGFNTSFLHLAWRDGHLYGSLIDILNRAAPLVLVSLGMTW
jgi:ABC-type branched-subunit amino acid transport system ATPase component